MSDSSGSRVREIAEEAAAKVAAAARSFAGRSRSQAGVDLRELVDPDGECVASLVDGERSAGAAALALPIDLILFETWALGHLGDRDELDLDVNTHREVWFGLGAWIGETLRNRHGGYWLVAGEDPHTWRVGFSKILLEIAPHQFAERLLQAGQGLGKRLLAEIERLRLQHEAEAGVEGEARDRFTPHHYARLHSVPGGQWMVIDLARLLPLWKDRPASALAEALGDAARRVAAESAGVFEHIREAIGKLDLDKPAAAQAVDRGLYEAVAQLLALKRATAPVPIDVLEKVVLPALHIGIPDRFPPLGEDDVANIGRGVDLFSVYVDVVPYAQPAADNGFLGVFSPKELGSPYADRANLDLGKGDWFAVTPTRLRGLLERFDPKKMLERFEKFIDWVDRQENVPRVREPGRGMAQQTARALTDLKSLLGVLDKGSALVFRLVPPPP